MHRKYWIIDSSKEVFFLEVHGIPCHLINGDVQVEDVFLHAMQLVFQRRA